VRFCPRVAFCVFAWLLASNAQADGRFADGQQVGLEIGLGGGWNRDSTPYTRTLETFGFRESNTFEHFRFSAALEVVALPFLSVVFQTNSLGRQVWTRDSGIGPRDELEWKTWTLDLYLRGFYPLTKRARVYAQLGVGPAFSPTRFDVRERSPSGQARYEELQVSYNVAAFGGVEALAGDHVGFFLQGGYVYAPTPRNELGDAHQAGGGLFVAGLSFRFVGAR